MNASDWLTLFVASAALALEVRRWFESGPSIQMTTIYPAVEMPPTPATKGKEFVSLSVTNRGSAATTMTHMVGFEYGDWQGWAQKRTKREFIVPSPCPYAPSYDPPYVLEPGRTWLGRVEVTSDLKRMIEGGWCFVGIICSHRDKPYLKRVSLTRNLPPKNAI